MKENKKNIEIHETAFVTSTFRSLDENLSQDYYAKLWNNNKTEKWMKEYLEEVSSEEVYTHCLRNRYFLDKIKNVIEKYNIEVLINFGCGFSMYPFLLNEKLINIEIDKPEVINYKKSKILDWQNNNIIPNRIMHFIGVDFTADYKKNLFSEIDLIKKNKSSFILIEGVLFFLSKKETNNLFNFFASFQKAGDFIGSASFQKNIKDSIAFKKLIRFFNKKVNRTKESDYQTIEDNYYKNKTGYKLIDQQDYFSLSKTYKNKVKLDKEQILNEHFYLLQKTK